MRPTSNTVEILFGAINSRPIQIIHMICFVPQWCREFFCCAAFMTQAGVMKAAQLEVSPDYPTLLHKDSTSPKHRYHDCKRHRSKTEPLVNHFWTIGEFDEDLEARMQLRAVTMTRRASRLGDCALKQRAEHQHPQERETRRATTPEKRSRPCQDAVATPAQDRRKRHLSKRGLPRVERLNLRSVGQQDNEPGKTVSTTRAFGSTQGATTHARKKGLTHTVGHTKYSRAVHPLR